MPARAPNFILGSLILAALTPLAAFAQTTERVSVDSLGVEGDRYSGVPAISADGRFVAFESHAANLVPGDTNGVWDVFVHDCSTGETTCVSVNSLGALGNGQSSKPAISADGRYVAFMSHATNLVPGDTAGEVDIFVHDRLLRSTERISVSSHGVQSNDGCAYATISADGRFVAFESDASNLVAGDTNGVFDVFLRDRQTGRTIRVSVDSRGNQGDSHSSQGTISMDGSSIAFSSVASNLVPQDTNGAGDVFHHDLRTGRTTRISLASSGGEGNGDSACAAMSADGRYVAFQSRASNLVLGDTNADSDVFVRDRQRGKTMRVSVNSQGFQGYEPSDEPSISADGRFVSFCSDAINLVVGDGNHSPDVFVHDLETRQVSRVSVDSLGVEGDFGGQFPSISADGRYVAFGSSSENLVPGDTNRVGDAFVHDRGPASGAAVGTIILAADLVLSIHHATEFRWFAAPPGARHWLLASAQNRGTILGGHPFGLGPGFRVIDAGRISARGTGEHATAPFPAWAQGRTVYVEVAARDAAGRIYDSNTVERTIR